MYTYTMYMYMPGIGQMCPVHWVTVQYLGLGAVFSQGIAVLKLFMYML